jgi:FeS assembly SUF system protein
MIAAFKTVFDPEIPVDIYELGLIYKIDMSMMTARLKIEMTLTAPGCPVAGDMPGWVENAARTVEGVKDVEVQLTFDPPWDPSRMSDEARVALEHALIEWEGARPYLSFMARRPRPKPVKLSDAAAERVKR